jgi:hypothetical protein
MRAASRQIRPARIGLNQGRPGMIRSVSRIAAMSLVPCVASVLVAGCGASTPANASITKAQALAYARLAVRDGSQ